VRAAAVHGFGLGAEDAHRLPIAFSKGAPDLLTKAGLADFIATLEADGRAMRDRYGVPLGLVLIDTWGQTFALDDENSAAQVNRAMKPLLAIAHATGATVVATHHFGHAAQRIRGSTAFRANADFVIEARKDGELFLEKCRDAAEVRLGWYELPIVQVGAKPDGRPITSRFVREIAECRRGPANAADGFTAVGQGPAVSDQDFDNAFLSAAAPNAAGTLEASVPAVRAAFYSRRPGSGPAKRQAWNRARARAEAADYFIDGSLISKRSGT
jgi:hypothetical protein